MKNTILLLFAGLLLFHGPVLALETIIANGVEGSADAKAGFAVVREAYKQIGYEIDMKWLPGATALERSNSGEVDAELQRIDGISRKFPNLIQVPIPINFLQGSVFATNVSFPVTGWYSLKPYRIGIVKGIIFAKQGTEGMDVKVADSYPDLLKLLANGLVDVAVMPRINGLAAIKDQEIKGIKELEGVLETLFLYHYVHTKNETIVSKLEKVLKQMLLDGTTRRLRDEAYSKLLSEE